MVCVLLYFNRLIIVDEIQLANFSSASNACTPHSPKMALWSEYDTDK